MPGSLHSGFWVSRVCVFARGSDSVIPSDSVTKESPQRGNALIRSLPPAI
jgi:hypothetical protein